MIPPDSAATAHENAMTAAVAQLESCFEHVYAQRMSDVPIVNKSLRVQAVGFRRWQDFWLGGLVTPWFINIVMLPVNGIDDALPPVGSKLCHALPAGNFSFISAYEAAIGPYLACSLLSPVLEIHSQHVAEQVACESLLAIMQPRQEVAKDHRDNTQDASPNGGQNTTDYKPSRRDLLQRVLAADAHGKRGRA